MGCRCHWRKTYLLAQRHDRNRKVNLRANCSSCPPWHRSVKCKLLFSGGKPGLGNARMFVKTIPYQLTTKHTHLRRSIIDAAAKASADEGLNSQWKLFILGPLATIKYELSLFLVSLGRVRKRRWRRCSSHYSSSYICQMGYTARLTTSSGDKQTGNKDQTWVYQKIRHSVSRPSQQKSSRSSTRRRCSWDRRSRYCSIRSRRIDRSLKWMMISSNAW